MVKICSKHLTERILVVVVSLSIIPPPSPHSEMSFSSGNLQSNNIPRGQSPKNMRYNGQQIGDLPLIRFEEPDCYLTSGETCHGESYQSVVSEKDCCFLIRQGPSLVELRGESEGLLTCRARVGDCGAASIVCSLCEGGFGGRGLVAALSCRWELGQNRDLSDG